VVLHWQQWRLPSATLDRVRAAVLAGAALALDQPAGPVRG
jgi:LysR family transcriptional regulator (chromosome initiation inhibitor)